MNQFNVCSFLIFLIFSYNHLAYAMEQRVGDFEIAIDAPWRMEPRLKPSQACLTGQTCDSTTAYTYGAIPVNIAILDALLPSYDTKNSVLLQRAWQAKERDDASPWQIVNQIVNPFSGSILGEYPNMFLESFHSLTVYEEINGQFIKRANYLINNLHEVERTIGYWKWSDNDASPPIRPTRSLCRRWLGDSCIVLAGLRNSSEWHGIAMYEPLNKTPGTDVKLKLELKLGTSTPKLIPGKQEISYVRETNTFTQYVNIHLGEAPLPKFSQNWYYGDIHYHSQGTDNDGESGYSYRSALQAMSALGLDFAFATDHASDSKQIISVATDSEYLGTVLKVGPFIPGVLRDLSSDRFAHSIGIVNNESGANRQVTSYPRKHYQNTLLLHSDSVERSLVTPQLFLGAEVDVIPEFENSATAKAPFSYWSACYDLGKELKRLASGNTPELIVGGVDDFVSGHLGLGFGFTDPNPSVCGKDNLLSFTDDGRKLIRDIQGPHDESLLSRNFYGRQHLLHLPEDPQRVDAFISSKTSKYGGATRRLKEILNSEFTTPNGILFLAHPLSTPSGAGINRLGPDIAPYSEASLLDAFRSKHVLGLQLWNENSHFKSDMGIPIPTRIKELLTYPIEDLDAFSLLETIKGRANKDNYGDAISTRPDKGKASTYKPSGLTGELIPVKDLKNWQHQEAKTDANFGRNLRMWDSMLMWGLDPSLTSSIDWLTEGEPRKIFMAGGSDAHGDYNYMRHGYFVGITSISDGAMGTPRNLVFAGSPQGNPITVGQNTGTPVSQKQIVDAFRDGNFIVTDGPIIRLAYDKNGNGIIDPQDIPMGGLAKIGGSLNKRHIDFPLLVEWKSTPEFGPVKEIDLEIGVFSDQYADGWFYRPWRDTTRDTPNPFHYDRWLEIETNRILFQAPNKQLGWRGKRHSEFLDSTDDKVMAIKISTSEGFSGIRKIKIDPATFPVAALTQRKEFEKAVCDVFARVGVDQPSPTEKSSKVDVKPPTQQLYYAVQEKQNQKPKVAYKKKGNKYEVERPKMPNISDNVDLVDDNLVPVDPDSIPYFGCTIRTIEKPVIADRMYIRAELKGKMKGKIPYKAFTNPIWFNIDDRYVVADKGAVVSFPDKLVQFSTKNSCSSRSKRICQSKKASCVVLSDLKGSAKDVCQWRSVESSTDCKRTVGFWTTPQSRYAQNHPNSILKGRAGACITEVKNIH